MLTRTDRRRFPVLIAAIAVLAMAMLFSPVQAQEGSAPDKPRGLEATATHDSVTLTWDDPGDDTITGYVVLRRIPGVDPQGHFSELVSNTGTDATTYTDDTVSAETRYTYRIKAINEHGVSERSRWSHVDVPAAPEAAEGDDPDGEGHGGGAPGGPGKKANVSEPSDGDCAAATTTTCEVDVAGSVMGNIESNVDNDWFKVVLEADKTYQIDLKGVDGGGGTLEDPFLESIRDSSDNEIVDTANDDIGGEDDILDSRTTFTPTAAGTYYLVARSANSGTGTYTLSVGEVETEEPACTLNEGDIWCGVVDVGDITNAQGETQSHGFQGTKGDLSDKTFSLMFETGTTNNYTITAIVVGARTAISEQLFFVTSNTLTNTEEESLALHVDGESDPFVWSDSTEVIPGSYRWPARTDLDWSSETTVTLRLREFLRPTVTNVAVTSMPVLETDTYGAGETIEVSVTFSEAVDATSNTDFVLSVGGARRAPLLSGSGTATLVFGYTVVSSDEDTNGIWIGDETRTLVGNRNGEAQNGTITSVATSAAANLDHTELGTESGHKVDGSRSIISVEVTSTPQLESDTYGAGETIQFTVIFNVAVDVDGDPVLKFVLGNSGDTREVDAAYVSGTGAKALVFGYTVVSTDEDNNGIYLRDEQDYDDPDGPVRLDSNDEIEFKDTSTDVPLYWQGRGNHSDHKVDGSRTTGNNPPSFTSSPTFDVAENQTVVGTVLAADSDADDSVTGYAITGGADQTFFSIGATSGALTFDAAPNYEDADDSGTNNTYVVDVTATSGAGTRVMTATQTITVTVTDVDTEAPGKPGTPTVSAGSATSLRVNWSAPSNAGPPITGYDVRHRTSSPEGSWTEKNVPSIAAVIESLSENTSYDVQVRATNAEGTGAWSDSGSGTTDAAADAANASPSFSSSSARNVAENTTAVVTVTATDSDADDSVTGYEITGGTDQNLFSIGASDGELTFKSAPNFEDPKDSDNDNDYVVVVQATSGTGTREKTATQTITVTVTDMSGEAPGKPAKPRVSAASATSLRVNWSAPSNAGPAITDYDVRYRAGTSGSWSDASHSGTAKATTLTGLTEDTPYQVQVRAKNAEGTGAWSDSGSGTPAEEDDLPADTTTTGEVEVGGAAVRGDIFAPEFSEGDGPNEVDGWDFDTDWFEVELEADKTYRIDMWGHTTRTVSPCASRRSTRSTMRTGNSLSTRGPSTNQTPTTCSG